MVKVFSLKVCSGTFNASGKFKNMYLKKKKFTVIPINEFKFYLSTLA